LAFYRPSHAFGDLDSAAAYLIASNRGVHEQQRASTLLRGVQRSGRRGRRLPWRNHAASGLTVLLIGAVIFLSRARRTARDYAPHACFWLPRCVTSRLPLDETVTDCRGLHRRRTISAAWLLWIPARATG
jgi:hypothetical protein